MDIGAFTGDTIHEFQQAVNDEFSKCYAFEPDQYNYDLLCENFKTDERIRVYKNGVGSQNQHVYFRNEQHSDLSHIVQNQEIATSEIEIVCLDSIIKEKVDLIKMDIEGMELEALRGAEQTIKEYKPMLAISIYHKIEDILEIPQYLINLNLGYRLYLRHYWNCNGTDSILFAI